MSRVRSFLWAVAALTLSASVCAAQYQLPDDSPRPPGAPVLPPYVTSWVGTPYTLPFGPDKTGQQVLSWALGMPEVQAAMTEAEAHGGMRRADTDFAYSTSSYACAVIGFELPGVNPDSAQALVCVCTKTLDDGRAATNIFAGTYGRTVVDSIAVPEIRDDVPGAFQVAVYWTDGGELMADGTVLPESGGGLFDGLAAWWNVTKDTQRYWLGQITTDRTVAAACINQVALVSASGFAAGAYAGFFSGGPGTAVLGSCFGGFAGACFGFAQFISRPPPQQPPPQNAGRPDYSTAGQRTAEVAPLGAQSATWGQVKARYAR
jgi:hypothetical protein